MFGSNLPIESIWTDLPSLLRAWLSVLAEHDTRTRRDMLGATARRGYAPVAARSAGGSSWAVRASP